MLRQKESSIQYNLVNAGNQLGDLGRDVRHWIFCSVQAASRGEQGADIAESFIRRVVHDGNELVTRQECRKLFVGDALSWRRRSSAGVTSTSPIRDFAKPLSMARIIGTPRPRSFSLNQT